MKNIIMLALIAITFVCNAESYGNNGDGKRQLTDHSCRSLIRRIPTKSRNYNSAAKQNAISKIEKLEKQIALNEKKIAENAEIERKTKYKGTTSFSTRDKTNQNVKLKKRLIEEKAKLRRMK